MKATADSHTWSIVRKQSFDYFEKALRDKPSGLTLLDLGAGPQYFRVLTERFSVIAVDKERYEGINVLADLNKPLPFSDESADIIFLSHTLEHIAEPQRLIDECYRILKKGGTIISVTPFLVLEHQGPHDFYRYTQYGLKYLFRNYSAVSVELLGTADEVAVEMMRKLLVKAGLHRYLLNILLFSLRLFLPRITDPKMTQGFGLTAVK